jgi:hypothetical protein
MSSLAGSTFNRLFARNIRRPMSRNLQTSFYYSTMRAARYYGKEDIRIENIPEPTVGAGQIKVSM